MHLLSKNSSCVGSDIGNYRQLECDYRMSMYASANTCVYRLDTEGGRDPASQLPIQRGGNERCWQTDEAEVGG